MFDRRLAETTNLGRYDNWARIAAAIVTEASQWGADAIILTELPRVFSLGLGHKVSRQVLRTATCPVLFVQPRT